MRLMLHRTLLALAFAALVTACATRGPGLQPPDLDAEQPQAPQTVRAALKEARKLPREKARARLLSWARDYLEQGRISAAGSLLDELNPGQLPAKARLEWVSLRGRFHLARQDSKAALALLNSHELNLPSLLHQAPTEQRNRLRLLRADALTLDGQLVASLRERVAIQPMLGTEQDRAYNRRMTWSLLMNLPMDRLRELSRTTESDLLGWVELARLFRDPLMGIDAQSEALEQWRQRWQGHPAERNTPEMIAALTRAAGERPEKVAVILPLSGPLASAGAVIRNGLLTGYYSALAKGRPVPELHFYDNGPGRVIRHYNQAIAAEADLVIGPLSKAQVSKLAGVDRLPVPTLALNRVRQEQPPENLYQFGLSPEDEARQVARQAYQEGARLAGVLYPDSDWGRRMARAYVNAFQNQGGLITTRQAFGDQETRAVGKLLSIGESHQRARQLNRLTKIHLQFKPRRRQDLDVLFLAANPRQARQVKPALNFHYARELPVFATSHVYSGTPNPERDRDLNNIRFVDMPWLLDRESSLRELARSTWPEGHGSRERLFALGIDAWRLQARLHMLASVPNSRLPGVTGRLRVRQNRQIVRELDWAYFHQGQPKRLPVVSGSTRKSGSENHVTEPITRPAGKQKRTAGGTPAAQGGVENP